MPVVIQIDAWDPVAGAAVTLRAASHDDVGVCNLNGQSWWPALITLPRLRYDLFDGSFSGRVATPGSSLTLATAPWPNLARWTMADARIRIWTGAAGAPWAAWSLRFDGRVTAQPRIREGVAEIAFAVDDRWLDTPLLSLYAGTGGAEGVAALKGQPKPLALGAPRFVAGSLIDPVNSVWQVSAYGAIQGVEAALERLLRYGPSAGDHGSYAALVAATVPAGRWATCLAEGLVRFGAPPIGKVSFLLLGDRAGPDGWVRRPGRIIRRIALLAGGAGRINEASLSALDAARPYDISLQIEQQTTARELIQRIAASLNAVAGVSWLGQLFVSPVAIGAPTLTLAADGTALPPVAAVEALEAGAPFWRLGLGGEPTWAVHELGDIAFQTTLIDRGAYSAAETYREGNIVQSGGASWVYINPAPTSGNAPPAPPATSNAFWRVLAAAGADGVDGTDGADGADGTQGPAGFTLAPASLAFSIACSADGTPKAGELPKATTFELRQGESSDLAADAATLFEIIAATGCTAALSGSRGQTLTVSAMSADSASVEVRGLRSGTVAAIIRVTLVKVRDGVAGPAGYAPQPVSANLNPGPVTIPYPQAVRIGAGGSRSFIGSVFTVSNANSGTLTAQIQVSESGANSWSVVATGSGTYAAFEPTAFDLAGSLTNSGGVARNYDLRLVLSRVGGQVATDPVRSFFRPEN